MKFKVLLTLLACVSIFSLFTTFNHKVDSQISVPSSTFDTFTINLSGSELNVVQGLVISINFSGGTTQLSKGVSFSASGAGVLLGSVDTTNNIISLALNGKITDGKANITGMINLSLTQGSPLISVSKVQATGGKDITGLLTIGIKTSSSLTPIPSPTPTPSPTASPTPSPSPTPTPSPSPSPTPKKKKPTITLEGPNSLILSSSKVSSVTVKVVGSNFTSKSRCQTESSDKSLAKVRPRRFLLSQVRHEKALQIRVLPLTAQELILEETEATITISVSCSNGAKASKELLLTH